MRIVIDLQGAQCGSRHRGIGRYSLALALAMVRNRGNHEVIIALNGLFPETIEPIRAAFDGLLPQDNIRIWYAPGPVHAFDSTNNWRRYSAELIREDFLARLHPDIVHISSLIEGFGDNAVHSIGLSPSRLHTAVTFYDLIPLIQSEVYLEPNPTFKALYKEKLDHLRRADLYLAISESARQEVIEHLGVAPDQTVNISAAADDYFKPAQISNMEEQALREKFKLMRPFVMYSGATDERKNHLRLIKAYSILPIEVRRKHQLAIVGGLPADHREKFETYIKLCGLTLTDVVITGRVTDKELVAMYNLCELFTFPSWHEGFGLPALEAMSCGAPVIGANTTSLPEVIGRSNALFDPFDEKAISQKIAQVLTNDVFRNDLARHGLAQCKKFSWDESAKRTLKAFEGLYFKKNRTGARKSLDMTSSSWLIDKIAKLNNIPTDDHDLLMVARDIAQNHARIAEKQLLVDISELVQRDAKTGIQRVVRSILTELLSNPPKGFKVEAIYASPGCPGYRYARKFTQSFSKQVNSKKILLEQNDEPVEVSSSDIFLGLDLHHVVLQQADFYNHLRCIGAKTYYVVYDLAPILFPKFFPQDIPSLHAQWLGTLAKADGLICISRAVADEMAEWLTVFGPERLRPLNLGWFHLGADVANSVPTKGLPIDATRVLTTLSSRSTFLSVGTIEPRKGHMQTLLAFEQLWDKGVDVNLVIVGKHGWNVGLLVEMLRAHSQFGKRLFWLDGISDEYLEKVYDNSSCLIAASESEGFGLPLIEAAQHQLPIIARDTAVFHEVAGQHAFYFSGLEPNELAEAVNKWLALDKVGKSPQSITMPSLTWKQSTQKLLQVILSNNWYRNWTPDHVLRYWGGDSRLKTHVGNQIGKNMMSTGRGGNLIHGPYLALEPGRYQITVRGTLDKSSPSKSAHIDVSLNQGNIKLAESILSNHSSLDHLAILYVTLNEPSINLETRVWVKENVNLCISMIEIAPFSDIPQANDFNHRKIKNSNSPAEIIEIIEIVESVKVESITSNVLPITKLDAVFGNLIMHDGEEIEKTKKNLINTKLNLTEVISLIQTPVINNKLNLPLVLSGNTIKSKIDISKSTSRKRKKRR